MKTFERIWPVISVLFLIGLVLALILYPARVGTLSITVAIISIGMAVIFTIRKNHSKDQSEVESPNTRRRETTLDLIGLALSTAAAMIVAGFCANWMAALTRTAQPIVTALAAVLTAILAGFITALIVRAVWGKLTRSQPKQPAV